MSRAYECDRCGKLVKRVKKIKIPEIHNFRREYELCESCAGPILDFLKAFINMKNDSVQTCPDCLGVMKRYCKTCKGAGAIIKRVDRIVMIIEDDRCEFEAREINIPNAFGGEW